DLDSFKQSGTHFGYKSVQVNRIIDSVHFVQSNNNYLMQLTDVLCYLIGKGKEAQRRLIVEYGEYRRSTPGPKSFKDWVDVHPHKGLKYFYGVYRRLGTKPWLFTKNFPT